MIELGIDILEGFAGLPSAVFGAILLTYAIYRMARHEVLLFGSVVQNDDAKGGIKPPLYTYSFLIQNLEEVPFPGPFDIKIRDLRYVDEPDRRFDVDVYAGPRHITTWTFPSDPDETPREWRATFEQLTPFDTWRFVVNTQSKWVELEIDTGDANTRILHRLIVDLSPRHVAVDAEHASSQVFAGTAVTPGLRILISIVIAAVLTYIGSISIIASNREFFGVEEFPFSHHDWYVVGAIVALLWLGYRRIQRPVYPIIQGYFLKTRTRKGERPSEKAS